MKNMTEKRMRWIEAEIGEHITSYVKRLIEEKKRLKEHPLIEGEFNGVIFQVTNDAREDALLAFFNAERERLRAEYVASDAYKKQQEAKEIALKELNQEATLLFEQLQTLDFSDYKTVLTWVKKYQPYSDHSGVIVPKGEILIVFTQNGYEVNADIQDKFQMNDPEIHARWIISKALDSIEKIGAMHPMVATFIEHWEEKFLIRQ